MNVSTKHLWILLGLATAGFVLSPHPSRAGDEPKKSAPKSAAVAQPVSAPQQNSTTNWLDLDDMPKFRPGRPKGEILEELHWVGDLEMATVDRGKTLVAISFYVGGKGGWQEFLWAIFVDDKFTKFVHEPDYWSSFPLPVGTFEPLHRAVEQKPIVFEEYLQDAVESAKVRAANVNPFLTAYAKAHEKEFMASFEASKRENAPFREQFNAERLKLGMTKNEVAAVLKAKPLDSGKLEVATFEIYGSFVPQREQSRNHYHNIVALYRDDRLSGIYSGAFAPGGKDGFERLRKPSGETPPCFTGLPPTTVKLLDAEQTVRTDDSPLVRAVKNNDHKALADLLARGTDPKMKDSAGTPILILAAKWDFGAIVESLLKRGADPNARNEAGSTALLEAVAKERVEVVGVLLAGGADVNAAHTKAAARGVTPLMVAVMTGNERLVQTLLEKGADVDAVAELGLTALRIAYGANKEAIFRRLQKAGAKK